MQSPPPSSLARAGLLVVEDDPQFADWTLRVLRAQVNDLAPVVAHDLGQARRLLREAPPAHWALAIVDLHLGAEDGIDLIRDLARDWPQLPVLVVTSVDAPEKALAAIRAGAQGYILKATVADSLLHAVDQARRGGSPITPMIARQLLIEFRAAEAAVPPGPAMPAEVLEKLSTREAEVLRLIARGHSNKETATALEISPATVDTHIRSIYRKLSINSRAELRRLLN